MNLVFHGGISSPSASLAVLTIASDRDFASGAAPIAPSPRWG